LQGPVGIWWNHYRSTFPANVEVIWDQFKEAFKGHFIPPGLMAIKHTEFMKLTQGNKSLNEYLLAFNNLVRYAPEFVDIDTKKIASFKRGLSPKLMKSMGNNKCIKFNEFISDTQLKRTTIRFMLLPRAAKGILRQVLLILKLLWWPKLSIAHLLPTSGIVQLKRRIRLRLAFARGTRSLYQRILLAGQFQCSTS
jgi:hypothetical protein